MVDACYTHVTIRVDDVDESADFYGDVFDMERIETPEFEITVQWLACGDLQLHLVETDAEPPEFNHHALHVDDFETVYERLLAYDGVEFEALGDPEEEFGDPEDETVDGAPPVYRMPNGSLQTYIRDPAGNLVEVDHHDADAIDETVVTNLRDRLDVTPRPSGEPEPALYGEAFRARIGLAAD